MDTATQALLGAAVAQAGFAHRLGRRAKWWGAAAGLLPDLDVIAIATHGPFGELLYHRGFTHSLWFGFVVGPLLGIGVHRLARFRARRGRGDAGPLGAWVGLFIAALVTHPLLDWFTPYGTQLLAPFSRQRFALDAVGIIDPFYSLPLALALLHGALRRTSPRAARRSAGAALAFGTAYLLYGTWLDVRLERQIEQRFARQGARELSVHAYPTLLQPWLRRVVVRADGRVHVGWVSTLRPDAARFEAFEPPSHPLARALGETREGRLFRWFAMDEVVAHVQETPEGTVVELDDLRYGMPGPPQNGMWGIRAFFDREGALRGRVVRFTRPATTGRMRLGALWRAARGDPQALGG